MVPVFYPKNPENVTQKKTTHFWCKLANSYTMTMLANLLEDSLDGCGSDVCNLHSTTRIDIMNLHILSTNKYSTSQESLEDAISIEQSILIEGTWIRFI